jgi:hypothetical protein
MVFKIIVIGFSLFVITRAVAQCRVRRISRYWAVLWSCLWIGVIVAALLPGWIDRLARFVGVSRGADLFAYIAILVLLYVVHRVVLRQQRTGEEMTALVRALALEKKRNRA